MDVFQSFRQSIKGDVVTPNDPGYEDAIKRWAANASRRAKFVVFVKDAYDISKALKYAKASGTHIAVRGGGHSPAGTSSTENGMVIDLSKYLQRAVVDPEKKLAYVQGGALWEHVDNAAAVHALAAVGGTVNHTGVGGLTTGGGYGYLSGEHGLAIDNLVQATVVTADGSIVTADTKESPDLFYGIRGGGSNFGVVAEFVFQLHDQKNKVYGGLLVFTQDKMAAVADELISWWPTATPKEVINCAVMTKLPQNGKPGIIMVMFYNGSKAEAERYTKRFTDIGPIADTRQEIEYKQMNALLNPLMEHGRCCWMRGAVMDDIPRMFTKETFDKIVSYSASGPFNIILTFECIPHGKINAVPAADTPYCRRLPGNAVVLVQWEENTAERTKEGLRIVTELSDMVKGPGEPYGNYSTDTEALPVVDGPVKPNRAKDLFRENYPKMQEIKKKYDPDMMFNKWFVINPDL